MKPTRVIALCGPNAIGKTTAAIRLATARPTTAAANRPAPGRVNYPLGAGPLARSGSVCDTAGQRHTPASPSRAPMVRRRDVTRLSARSEATTRRTYNRPLDDEGSKFETWEQTVERAQVEHQRRLWADAGGSPDEGELAELRALGLSRAGLVSGRTLWLGGTKYAYERAASQFNCSGLRLDTVYDMVDAFWLLLNGCGVGGRPRAGTLHGYPQRIRDLEVIDSTRDKDHRGNESNVETMPCQDNGWTWTIKIGDSAVAWARALGKLLVAPRLRTDRLRIDVSDIRGPGGRLRGYGWICNGAVPLVDAIKAVHAILNRYAGNLLTEEVISDIFNWCGTVLSSRRAAEALVLDAHHPYRKGFSVRKKNYWLTGNDHRRQSNNSLIFWQTPSVDDIADLLYMILEGGEPGFVNGEAALRRCPWFDTFNPCLTGDTLVAVADGRNAVPIAQLAEESGGVNRFDVYSARPSRGGKGGKWKTEITSAVAILTGEKQVGRLLLSNGDSVRLTADHRVALADGTYRKAAECVGLQVESFFTKATKGNRRLINTESNAYAKQYRMMWERYHGPKPDGYEIDHVESDGGDRLDNLQLLTREEHLAKTAVERQGDANPVHRIKDRDGYRQRKAAQTFGANNPRHSGLTDEYLIDLATTLHRDGIKVTINALRALDPRVPSSFSKNRFGGSVANLRAIAAGEVEYTPPTPPAGSCRDEPEPDVRREQVTVLAFEPEGVEPVYDLIVEKNRNFYVITSGDEAGNYLDCRGLLVHNCFEIVLPSHGFCVSGETVLMTRDSAAPIADLAGKPVEVWNGERWSRVVPQVTGRDRPLVRVTMSDGSYLDCTPEHRFSIRRQDRFEEVHAKNLQPGDVSELFRMEEGGCSEEVPVDAAYTLGVLVGDGSAEGSRVDRGRKWVEMSLHGPKRFLPILGEKGDEYTPKGYRQPAVKTSGVTEAIEAVCKVNVTEFVHSAREDGYSIRRVLGWSRPAMLAFLAGLADTDGSETGTGGIRIYQDSREFCETVQLILRKCGMRSSLCQMADVGDSTNWGVRNKAMWYVQVTECQTIPCHRLDTSRGHAPGRHPCNQKGVYQRVVSVDRLPGKHTVYCFTEPHAHKAVFGNILTYQCNLVSLALPSFGHDFASLERAVYVMARANYRQTCVNLKDDVLQNRWHQTNESLRLCGVSLTGIVQAPWLTDYDIRRLRNAAVTGAYSMADELRMPRPKAVTTIKPEGTRSKITGTVEREVAEGMHRPLGRFIFNWVNFSVHDPLVEAMEAAGYRTLPHPTDQSNVLVRFPVEYRDCRFDLRDGKEVNYEPAVTQLRRYRRWNDLWADHNVSATVSFERDEVPDMARWIHRNWGNSYVATAFLKRADPSKTARDLGFNYLPQEVVTEEVFREAQEQTREVDWDRFHHGWYEIADAQECAGGACPVR